MQNPEDLDLVRAVLAGDSGAVARLVARISPVLRAAAQALGRDAAGAEAAFAVALDALKADSFARFRPYDGRSRLETFAALVARDALGRHVMALLGRDAKAGWRAFEALFGADLDRLIRRRLPGAQRDALRQDAYQDICAGLIVQDYRRLRAYDGRGSITGFVLHTADRLLIDFIRSTRAGPRPALRLISLADAPKVAETEAAGASPEEIVAGREGEAALALAAGALKAAADELPEAERLYVRILLAGNGTLPAREVARLMGRPVAEVYKLKQRLLQRLRDQLRDDAAVKNWLSFV